MGFGRRRLTDQEIADNQVIAEASRKVAARFAGSSDPEEQMSAELARDTARRAEKAVRTGKTGRGRMG